MRFGVLGPVLVETSAGAVEVAGARQRALLTALLLGAGRAVSTDRLAEIVWDGRPSAGAAASLPKYVMRLRASLGAEAGRRLVSSPGGYAVRLEDGELDLARFRAACQSAGLAAAAGEWTKASELFGTALDEAHALEGIGRCTLQIGDRPAALGSLRDAVAIYQRIGAAEAGQAAAWLAAVEKG